MGKLFKVGRVLAIALTPILTERLSKALILVHAHFCLESGKGFSVAQSKLIVVIIIIMVKVFQLHRSSVYR